MAESGDSGEKIVRRERSFSVPLAKDVLGSGIFERERALALQVSPRTRVRRRWAEFSWVAKRGSMGPMGSIQTQPFSPSGPAQPRRLPPPAKKKFLK
jgi:hypothetical protein